MIRNIETEIDRFADTLPELTALEILDEYGERLIAPIVGTVPYAERARLKNETLFHLERLRDDFVDQGLSEVAATKRAIEVYGSADLICQQFLDSWFRKRVNGPIVRRFGFANLVALASFGLAQVVCVSLLQARVFLPEDSVFQYAISPASVNELIPIGVPIPEFTPLYFASSCAVLLSPMIAGWVVGKYVPVHAARAALQAMLICAAHSLVAGLLLLPGKELLLLGFLQLVLWLPTGAILAAVSSALTREKRCRRGEQ